MKRQLSVMGCPNVKECACPKKTCPNNGKCCACVIKHRETGSLPCCLFPDSNDDKSNRNHYEVLKRSLWHWLTKLSLKSCGLFPLPCYPFRGLEFFLRPIQTGYLRNHKSLKLFGTWIAIAVIQALQM